MKKKKKWKKWLIVSVSVLIVVFIIVIGNAILTSIIQKKMGEALRKLSPKIHTDYSSIHANLFSSSASINNLRIHFIPYANSPQYQHSIHFNKVMLVGINFFKVIFNNTLSIREVSLNKGEVKLDHFLLDKKDSGQAIIDSLHVPFKNIAIANLKLPETTIWLHSGAIDQLLLKANLGLQGATVNIGKKSAATNAFKFTGVQCSLSDISYAMPGAHQSIRIKKLMLNSMQQTFFIDSLKIIRQKNNIKSPMNRTDQLESDEITAARIEVTKFNLLQLFPRFVGNKDSSKKDPGTSSVLLNDLYVHLVQNNKGQQYHHSFYCKYLAAENIDFEKTIFCDSIFIDVVNLERCDIKIDRILLNKDEVIKGKMLSQLNIPFKNFSVNKLTLSDVNIWLHSAKEEQLLLKGGLTINKAVLKYVSNPAHKEFHLAAITCDLSSINYPLPGGKYIMDIKELIADSRKQLLRIKSLQIIPRYSKYELGKKSGLQEDWINTNVGDIEISKLEYPDILYKKLTADKITFNNCKIYVFRDRRLPRPLKQQPMPNDYLKKIPLDVRVRLLKINNASVVSEEFPKDGTQPGTLQFENMNISMSPLLNHPYKNDPVYSDTYIRGNIMNSGLIKATIHAPLEKNIYYIRGTIENLNLSKLNSSAENLGKFHIQSGILNSLYFHFTATEKKANGEVIGEYHNLIIEKLKIKNGVKKVAKGPTFFLKHLIIPKNKDKSLDVARRTGKIDYKRDPTRMVTFYFLKSLLSGIRASFGLGFLLPK